MQCYTESRIVPDGEYEAILRRIDVHRPRRDLRKENSLKPGDSVTCWVFLSFEILDGAPGAEGPLRWLHYHERWPNPESRIDRMQRWLLEAGVPGLSVQAGHTIISTPVGHRFTVRVKQMWSTTSRGGEPKYDRVDEWSAVVDILGLAEVPVVPELEPLPPAEKIPRGYSTHLGMWRYDGGICNAALTIHHSEFAEVHLAWEAKPTEQDRDRVYQEVSQRAHKLLEDAGYHVALVRFEMYDEESFSVGDFRLIPPPALWRAEEEPPFWKYEEAVRTVTEAFYQEVRGATSTPPSGSDERAKDEWPGERNGFHESQ